MHSYFWWGYKIDPLLFQGYVIKSVLALVATCLGLASLTFLFEWTRYLQAKVRQREIYLRSKQLKTICPNESTVLLNEPSTSAGTSQRDAPVVTVWDRTFSYGSEFVIWFLMQNLGYIIMLCVMAYNGWLFISAILGGTIGYFIFGQMFMKVNMQNCQIMRETFCMAVCDEPGTVASHADGESTPVLTSRPSTNDCREDSVIQVNVHCDSR